MTVAARVAGVDLSGLEVDVGVLRTAHTGLGERWADAVGLTARAQDLGLRDEPTGIAAELPERLRADLDALGHILEAAEAALDGLTAVCGKLAAALGDAIDDIADVFDEREGAVVADPVDPAVDAARAGAARIDAALGKLDGELVLIGGR
ncbi:hypothetical protein GOARA_021_01430 [Gordonia araii NBRC 100433]|uniref:Uncharacterized protein n=1 Tax=Gordonia araii NBRC 100433 TaxID=1073574 RepID=G7GZ80_9ACTN|nr:hypothetical protein [Gordonia araii]NNG97113.1 hypothetical protein [Gordonia araii NBRC 100433]GAB08905.1 hypothetical protein GOARA_021_01430 [Gordonia araii NBRC 100433]